MDDNKDKAYLDYQEGMKYKDIAEKYNVSINTVKSWKKRHAWTREKGAHKTKGVHTKSVQENARAPNEKEPVSAEIDNDELTEKQRLFCMYYTKYFNATKAYQKAYECAYSTAMVEGHRTLRNPKIISEIGRVKSEQVTELKIGIRDVLQKYIDIAFSDIGDYVERDRIGYSVSVKLFEEMDMSIITEISNTENGLKIKFADKMKALEFLSKYFDLLSENDRKKLQEEKLKADIAKARSETKGTGNTNISVVDFSNLSTEELRAIANSNKRTD